MNGTTLLSNTNVGANLGTSWLPAGWNDVIQIVLYAEVLAGVMISVARDKTGAIVDGNPDKVADITDVWTFARDTSSRDPNWKLVGTGSAA